MKKMRLPFICIIVAVLVIAVAGGITLISLQDVGSHYSDTRLAEIKSTVLSCVAQCYALEGRYPPDLGYLENNYGLRLDTDRYLYHYEMFASNIFPDVQVFLKGTGD